jgi:hypothetical protein
MQVEIEALQQEVERERNLKLQAEGAAAQALLRNTPSEASTPREIELEGELQVVKSAQWHLMQATKVDKAELSAGENPDNVFFLSYKVIRYTAPRRTNSHRNHYHIRTVTLDSTLFNEFPS